MTSRVRIALFWLIALGLFLLFLFTFRTILLPFVAGMILAYALDPVADWMEARGFGRLGATVLILLVFLILLILGTLALGPILLSQLSELVRGLPGIIEQAQDLLGLAVNNEIAEFFGLDADSIRGSVREMLGSGAQIFSTFVQSVWSGGRALANIASLMVVTPFVAFYLLRDWKKVEAWVDDLLPREHADEIRKLGTRIDAKVAAFVRGQLLVGLILGTFYAVGLMAVGLNYGLLIGMISGMLSFVPYLGFAVGFALSAIVSLVQFSPDWVWPAVTIGIYLAGQFLEGYVLYPRILGSRVGMHPVWLFFSLFAFGYLLGFVGLLVAVPAAAAVGVLFSYAIERYRASPMYTGGATRSVGGDAGGSGP